MSAVDLKLSTETLHGNWLIQSFDEFRNNKECLRRGWIKYGSTWTVNCGPEYVYRNVTNNRPRIVSVLKQLLMLTVGMF